MNELIRTHEIWGHDFTSWYPFGNVEKRHCICGAEEVFSAWQSLPDWKFYKRY